MLYCVAAAVAAPPGITRPNAPPASCEVATPTVSRVPIDSACSSHRHQQDAASASTIATSHHGLR